MSEQNNDDATIINLLDLDAGKLLEDFWAQVDRIVKKFEGQLP